jgi:hypothetical protein
MISDVHGWMGQLDVFAWRERFVPLDKRLICFYSPTVHRIRYVHLNGMQVFHPCTYQMIILIRLHAFAIVTGTCLDGNRGCRYPAQEVFVGDEVKYIVVLYRTTATMRPSQLVDLDVGLGDP